MRVCQSCVHILYKEETALLGVDSAIKPKLV